MADPRHMVLPEGIVSTGWPAVRDTSAQIGVTYDPWQQDLNRAMLAKDADGLYAADVVGLSMPRQSGKTYDVAGVVCADSIIHPGTTTVWTAHKFKVSRESFDEMRGLASTPRMLPHVDPEAITTAAGNETIRFRNGSRIVFAARERGAIRGFTKVRRLVLDEAQILTDAAMSDLAPTTNQAHNPQIVLMGTPPKPSDPSEAWSGLRQDALDGKAARTLWVEYGADPKCDLDDWAAVAEANPSYPLRTSARSIERLRKLLASDDDFAREALGVWAETSTRQVIDPVTWALRADAASMAVDRLVLAIDVAPDRSVAAVGLAGLRVDGRWHVELDEHRTGVDWVGPWVEQRAARNTLRAVVADEMSGLVEQRNSRHFLKGTDVVVTLAKAEGRDMAIACAGFYDGVMGGTLVHTDQPQVNVALSVARKRPIGAGWAWNRKSADSDITPVVAETLALWGSQSQSVNRPGRGTRAGSSRRAVVL